MSALSAGARRLPMHHITIRVPWHDGGWTSSVCTRPLENTSCLILPRIGEGKRDDVEARCAGQRFDEFGVDDQPPCAGERVSFMATFDLTRSMRHPYAKSRRGGGVSLVRWYFVECSVGGLSITSWSRALNPFEAGVSAGLLDGGPPE